MFEIRSDLPLPPPRKRAPAEVRGLLRKMQVGDSICVPADIGPTVRASATRIGILLAGRTKDGVTTFWRTL